MGASGQIRLEPHRTRPGEFDFSVFDRCIETLPAPERRRPVVSRWRRLGPGGRPGLCGAGAEDANMSGYWTVNLLLCRGEVILDHS